MGLDCSKKVDINTLVEEEISQVEKDIAGSLTSVIGQPYSHVPFLTERLKTIEPKINKSHDEKMEVKRLKRAIEDEKKRHKAHTKLFNYLTKSLVKFDKMNKHRTPTDILVGQIATIGRHEFGDLFDMTDSWYFNPKTFNIKTSKLFDYRKTLGIHNFFKNYFEAPIPTTMSKWADQIQHPMKSVFARDRTGYGVRAVEKSLQLFDDRLLMAHQFIEKINKFNGAFTQHVGADQSDEAYTFLVETAHGINRMIIPQNEMPTDELFERYNINKKLESARHSIESNGVLSEYVVIKISPDELVELRKKRKDIPVNAEVWYSYKIDDIENNEMKEGWYEAVSDKQIVGEKIEGTVKDKKVLKDFNYMKQPNKNWFGDTAPGASNFWDTLFSTRELLENVKRTIKDKHDVQNKNASQIKKQIMSKDTDPAIKKLVNSISGIGGEDSFFFKNSVTGDLEVPFVYMREMDSDYYFPAMYEEWVFIEMLEETISKLGAKMDDINAKASIASDIVSNKKASSTAKKTALKEISFLEKLAKDTADSIQMFQKKLDMAVPTPDSPDYERRELTKIYAGVHSKHRAYFTDRKKARTDKDVLNDYVHKMFQAVVSNDMRLAMLETALNTDPVTAEFVIDQGAVVMGDVTTRASFGPIKYDNVTVAKWMAEHYKGSDIKITPELVHQQTIFLTSYISSVNLGFGTAITNNFQRLNNAIEYGFKMVVKANQIRRKGDGVYTAEQFAEFARHAGVLEPTLFFADILSIGAEGSDAYDFVVPYKDLVRLKLSKKEFVKGTDHFDKMLKNTTLREKNRILALKGIRKQAKLTLDEIAQAKKRKEVLYDFIYTKEQDVKKLTAMAKELQLIQRDSYIRKLVQWKLAYFPGGESLMTMLGTETAMRTEDAIIGFLIAKERGMLDEYDKSVPLYKQANAVRMARLVVYNSSFGMSSQFHAKMFRGIGKGFWQYKQYQWSQSVHDWKINTAFINSSEYQSFLGKGAEGLYRLTKEAARITGKPLTKQATSDIPANKMIKFLLSRGMASIASLGMFGFLPLIGEPLAYMARAVSRTSFGGRGVRGMTTPLLMYPLRIMYLAYMIATNATGDDDDLERGTKEVLMDWLPPIMNVLLDFMIDPANAPRPVVPHYRIIKDAVFIGGKAIEQ